ncbi:hypothetical protein EK21DRAFT_103520 [Setomelanomma holmii]|uniref:alpha-galactosidase n=1 Tax=Setomelanomma holmii TaxID=210430 RepID=A0A9P4H2V9_9PLEO|nr:hypothetical protein EK21DRAFT_103520 [Setomelanomma holmii]
MHEEPITAFCTRDRKDENATFTRGQKFQIILLGVPDMSEMPLPPSDAAVWDIDLFDNPASTMQALKAAGKMVWMRTGSQPIRTLMAKRIELAADKGCDAIDPDNTAKRQWLNLRNTNAIDYMRWMQKEAAKYDMMIGLKNSLEIVSDLTPIIDFAVNEQCAQLSECNTYSQFLAVDKPVFHIEYPMPLNAQAATGLSCIGVGISGMSTILKDFQLNGITYYCDGSYADTPTLGVSSPILSMKIRTTPSPSRTSSTQKPPTSTPGNGGGGGCKQKHWDQCGGNDWKGCAACESPYTCKGVSPPYYYQCL